MTHETEFTNIDICNPKGFLKNEVFPFQLPVSYLNYSLFMLSHHFVTGISES